jgi:tRNA pseudouridine55 synthase
MKNARRISGLLLLDKPSGPSSNAALQRVRRAFRAEKAGHTGALDPLASGLLPICLGEATKLAGLMLSGDKGYRVTAQLGSRTDTLDAEGEVVERRPVPPLDEANIECALATFRGSILQVPPMYSALKRNGRPLYELARRGISVERPARAVQVDRLSLVALDLPQLTLDADVSSGTYIRTLIDDLGQALGCGAHIVALRRTWAAPFRMPAMLPLVEIEAMGEAERDALLLPIEAAVAALPGVTLQTPAAEALRRGQVVEDDGADVEMLAAFDAGRLIAIARREAGKLRSLRGINND